MKKTYVVGDIHGNYKGLKQALERSNFDYENDILITLGDIVDGHTDTYEVIEELLKIKNRIDILGNHDDWFNTWLQIGKHPTHWLQGAKATAESYLKQIDENDFYLYSYESGSARLRLTSFDIPLSHKEFFKNQIPYYVDSENRLFVHGGFNRHFSIKDPIYNKTSILIWDRDLWLQALSCKNLIENSPDTKVRFRTLDDFKEIYIGHTSVQNWDESTPMQAANVWNMDTGGGGSGKVTIMNIDTKEFYQSDNSSELYPEFKGRN